MVVFLKKAWSAGSLHGIRLFRPMTRFRSIATIKEMIKITLLPGGG
jgi:hypothetical protein